MMMLWDTHDRNSVATHGLLFETRAGQGRLLVSALRHDHSPAGLWLLQQLIAHLHNSVVPVHALSDQSWHALKDQIGADELPLTRLNWSFKPDRTNVGISEHWESTNLDTSDWKPIQIGKSWESQGYPDLDGWAWYRLQVKVPVAWQRHRIFLTFTGVDDLYELYINGELLAKCGDLPTRQSTFFEKRSHDLTGLAKPGETLCIAVRVYDWFGAGGIFQPAYLGTTPFAAMNEILSRGQH